MINLRYYAYQRDERNLSISEITKVEKNSGLAGEVGERESGARDLRDILFEECVCVCVSGFISA